MIRWRRAALQYPCESCGAAPGQKCITIGGNQRYEIHQARADRASQDNWVILGDEDDGPDGRARPRPGHV